MPRCQYAALLVRKYKRYALLRNIVNLETGLLFRDHCWIEKFKLFKEIPTGNIIIFNAKEVPYKKRRLIKMRGLGAIEISWEKCLIKLSNIQIASENIT